MEPLVQNNRIIGVKTFSKEGIIDIRSHITIDATGDGDIAFLAGAEYEKGRDAGQVMGVSEENPFGRDPNPDPYDIPYGCLIPRKFSGLLTAGRCISGSHKAHSSYRVQQIAMAIGSSAGVGAALAHRDQVDVRKVDVKKMQKILFND